MIFSHEHNSLAVYQKTTSVIFSSIPTIVVCASVSQVRVGWAVDDSKQTVWAGRGCRELVGGGSNTGEYSQTSPGKWESKALHRGLEGLKVWYLWYVSIAVEPTGSNFKFSITLPISMPLDRHSSCIVMVCCYDRLQDVFARHLHLELMRGDACVALSMRWCYHYASTLQPSASIVIWCESLANASQNINSERIVRSNLLCKGQRLHSTHVREQSLICFLFLGLTAIKNPRPFLYPCNGIETGLGRQISFSSGGESVLLSWWFGIDSFIITSWTKLDMARTSQVKLGSLAQCLNSAQIAVPFKSWMFVCSVEQPSSSNPAVCSRDSSESFTGMLKLRPQAPVK